MPAMPHQAALPRIAFVIAFAAISGLACSSLPPVRAIRAARYYAAGSQALDRGDAAVAIAELERAAALMPNASEIQNHLGLAYWSDGREDAARQALGRALELDCDNAAARTNLARLQREQEAAAVLAARDGQGGVVGAGAASGGAAGEEGSSSDGE